MTKCVLKEKLGTRRRREYEVREDFMTMGVKGWRSMGSNRQGREILRVEEGNKPNSGL